MATPERRLAALMFTDMVGFTAQAQQNESEALRLRREYQTILRSLFETHRGREVKSLGDGFLVEFASAVDAVNCSLAIQTALARRNRSVTTGRDLLVRIGLHVGDVVREGDDLVGDALNVASRIEPLAEPGGIVASGQVFDHVRNKVAATFAPVGRRALKNVVVPVELYQVRAPADPGPSVPDPTRGKPPSHRLAVLPFANLSRGPDDEFFADGLTEEMIGELSRTPGILVIARTSVMRYKGGAKGIRDVGQELNVDVALEGSVRKVADRIRITVQLIDTATEGHLWSEQFDRELTDILAVQSEIAQSVARALLRGPFAPGPRRETGDIEAYTAYLRAVRLLNEDTRSSIEEARRLLDEAVARDPSFGRAHAGLARAWNTLVNGHGADWSNVRERAEPAARRAVELAPESAESHAVMADVHGMLDRFPESIREAEEAIRLNPSLANAYEILGRQRSAMGLLADGLEASRRAYELDPLSVDTGVNLAWLAQLAGHEDEAHRTLEALRRLHPGETRVTDALAEYHSLRGELPVAESLLEEAVRNHPLNPALRTDLGVVYALEGKREAAETALLGAERDVSEMTKLLAILYIRAALGDLDEAFPALLRLAEVHAWPYLMEVHPLFAKMRADPRYSAFRRAVGLPPGARPQGSTERPAIRENRSLWHSP